ncbi:MAG: imidazolonepropionase-like amidohydrolase [Gammaproteobacteria bacterium]|jgi:imidazolonepropionase-like amidohydrolase
MFKLPAIIFLCFFLVNTLFAETVVIHAGTLLAVPGEAALKQQSVVIENGKVLRVEAGYINIPDSEYIDLRCCFVLPGLIDLHVHLTSPVEPGGQLRVVTESSADLAIRAVQFAKRTLEAGFTTVVDLGTGHRNHAEAIFALRRATQAHKVAGPRIIAAGSPISPTGLSRTALYRAEVEAVVGPEGVCNGADDCRRAVREQVKSGADIINFYNTGSLLDEYMVEQTFTDEEMRAIVETAHALGRRVIADGHSARGVNAALRAGADIVDTVPWPDEDTWRLLKKTGAFFVPHLYAFEASLGDTEESLRSGTTHWLPEPILKRLLSVKQNPYSAVEAHKRGINIAFGSDTGVIEHGDNASEFVELVKAGLSPNEALVTATSNAAEALGLQASLGKLEQGYAADIIALAKDPLADIHELKKVVFVMRDGVVYKMQ